MLDGLLHLKFTFQLIAITVVKVMIINLKPLIVLCIIIAIISYLTNYPPIIGAIPLLAFAWSGVSLSIIAMKVCPNCGQHQSPLGLVGAISCGRHRPESSPQTHGQSQTLGPYHAAPLLTAAKDHGDRLDGGSRWMGQSAAAGRSARPHIGPDAHQ